MSPRSRLLKVAYQLHRYELGGRPLDRWLGIVLVLVGLLGALIARWGITFVAGLLLLGLILYEAWARHVGYVEFVAQGLADDGHVPVEKVALDPQDKIPIRATGRFEVEGRSQFFVELQAFFRTFATREHAVIAYVPRSRFLGISQWPSREVGMWYIFFLPRQVVGLAPGRLGFGREHRPALRILYQGEKRVEAVYLSFDDEAARRRVWSDILWDAAFQQE